MHFLPAPQPVTHASHTGYLELCNGGGQQVILLEAHPRSQQLCGMYIAPRTGVEVILLLLLPECLTQAI